MKVIKIDSENQFFKLMMRQRLSTSLSLQDLKGLAPISYRKMFFMILTMFCSGSFHHTIMLFDWEINIHVCSKKIWSVTCTF